MVLPAALTEQWVIAGLCCCSTQVPWLSVYVT